MVNLLCNHDDTCYFLSEDPAVFILRSSPPEYLLVGDTHGLNNKEHLLAFC